MRTAARLRLSVAMFLLPVLAANTVSCGSGRKRPVRLVLVTLDTLRLDAFAGSSDHPSWMPRSRQFAARGRVFDRHYSATSTTLPTHASLLTGLHPWQHGVTRNGQVLQTAVPTVAERLLGAGYRTGAVVASFPLESRFGLDRGFERYVDEFDAGNEQVWNGEAVPAGGFYSLSGAITSRALKLLDDMGPGDQFLWVHYYDPHVPYGDAASVELVNPWDVLEALRDGDDVQAVLGRARDAYGQDVRTMDAALGLLFDRLDRERGDFETHVVVVADHGESFGEDGSLGHGTRLTPWQIHVPLFVVSPRVAPDVVATPTGSVDVARTILALAGVPPIQGMMGHDLSAREPVAAVVVGMRQTVVEAHRDLRLDGKVYPMRKLQFYLVDGARILSGNQQQVNADPVGRVPPDPRARVLFAGFEEELSRQSVEEMLDADSQAALRELGYVR